MTGEEMVRRLALACEDWEPGDEQVPGQPSYTKYDSSIYLSWVREREEEMVGWLPVREIFTLLHRIRLKYKWDGIVDLSNLSPPFLRLVEDGVYTGFSEEAAPEPRKGAKATKIDVDEFTLTGATGIVGLRSELEDSDLFSKEHAHTWTWGSSGGDHPVGTYSIIVQPIPQTPYEYEASILYLRRPKVLVMSSPSGYQTTTSELPTKWHSTMLNGAMATALKNEGQPQLALHFEQLYISMIQLALGKQPEFHKGGAMP